MSCALAARARRGQSGSRIDGGTNGRRIVGPGLWQPTTIAPRSFANQSSKRPQTPAKRPSFAPDEERQAAYHQEIPAAPDASIGHLDRRVISAGGWAAKIAT